MGRMRTVVLGGLLAGFLDITYAILLFGFRSHVPAIRIGQGIASHLVGLSSFNGGWATAALGFGLHFTIAVIMALAFYAICTMVPAIARHALAVAPVYGIILFAVMTYIVLPMTDPRHGPAPLFPPAIDFSLFSALFAHIVLVAFTIAWMTKRALRES